MSDTQRAWLIDSINKVTNGIKSLKMLTAASILVLAASEMALADEVHWGYDPREPEGPQHWGSLVHSHGGIAYPACNGTEQSPIDIDVPDDQADVPISFNLNDTPLNVHNNGHSIQVDYETGSSTIASHTYDLLQFHFHTNSEHAFNGSLLAAEAHMVHIDTFGVSKTS